MAHPSQSHPLKILNIPSSIFVVLIFLLPHIPCVVDDPLEQGVRLLSEVNATLSSFQNPQFQRIVQLRSQIELLSEELKSEVELLNSLEADLIKIKQDKGFLWPFDADARFGVSLQQNRVNEQTNKVASKHDEIMLQWQSVKTIYGLRSRMFLSDLFFSFVNLFDDVRSIILPSWVTAFPMTAVVLLAPLIISLVIMKEEFASVLLIISISSFVLVWGIRLPMLIVQYGATLPQFFLTYFFVVFLLLAVIAFAFSVFCPFWRRVRAPRTRNSNRARANSKQF